MKKIFKKAFIFRTLYLVVFVVVVILLVFMIKNQWDVNAAFNDMLSLLRLSKSQ